MLEKGFQNLRGLLIIWRSAIRNSFMRHRRVNDREERTLKLQANPGFLCVKVTATCALFWDTINGTSALRRKSAEILKKHTFAKKAFLRH
jgi:hypothetical protein